MLSNQIITQQGFFVQWSNINAATFEGFKLIGGVSSDSC